MSTGEELEADVALVVGVTDYDDVGLTSLPAGAEEASLVLEAAESVGFARCQPLVGRVTHADVERYLARSAQGARRVLLYWTGHGRSDARGDWLFTTDSISADPSSPAALDPPAIATLLAHITDAAQIVVVLDCCGAGASALQIARAVATTKVPEPALGRKSPAVSFISATYGEGEAQPRVFARAFADALRLGPPSAAWPSQKPMLSPQEVAEAAEGWLRTNQAPELQRSRAVGLEAGTGFFRNPGYDPRARDALVDGAALVRRKRVLESIYSWLGDHDEGLYLLTGSAGSGKSVLLDQLVTEASASGRRDWISVDLHSATAQSLSGVLGPRLGLPLTDGTYSAGQIVRACITANQKLTLVADSLDRAESGQRLGIIRDFLIPLAHAPRVQVVVADRGGARAQDRIDELAELREVATGTLDLDTDPDSQNDIARHVLRVLLATPFSPYTGQASLGAAIADEVARRSSGVFQVANSVAYSLARAPDAGPVDDYALDSGIRAATAGLIEQDFARFGARAVFLLEVLTPLAWLADGCALPLRDWWPTLVNALRRGNAGPPEVDADRIDGLLADVGSYLTVSHEGRPAYRMRHPLVAKYLRAVTPLPEDRVHARICQAMRPAPDAWRLADDFVLQHIAYHAERGGLLGDLFGEPEFLIYAEPRATLAAALRMEVGSRSKWDQLYLRAAARLPGLPAEMRAYVLESVACEGLTRQGLPAGLSFSVPAPCWTRWSTAGRPAPHLLMRAEPDALEAVAAVRTPAGIRLAVASHYQLSASGRERASAEEQVSVEVWDPSLTDSVRLLPAIRGTTKVEVLAAVPADGEDLLIIAYSDDILEASSLASDQVLWRHDGVTAYTVSVVPAGREQLIATTNSSGPVILRRIDTGEIVRTLPQVSGSGIFAVGPQVPGGNLVCVGTNTGFLDFFNAETGQHLSSVEPEVTWTNAVAPVVLGQPRFVGARGDGRIEVRDATGVRVLSLSLEGTGSAVESMSLIGAESGDPLIAMADGLLVSVWTSDGRRRAIYRGHSGGVSAVCTVGGAGVASAASDGSVRIWGNGSGEGSSSHDARTAKGEFSKVYSASAQGRRILLGEDLMRYVVIDGTDGHAITSYPKDLSADPELREVWGVISNGEEVFALAGHTGESQLMWSLRDGKHYTLPTPGADGRRRPGSRGRAPLAALASRAGPLLVIGGESAPVGVFDFYGQVRSWLSCPPGSTPRCAVPSGEGELVLVREDERTFAIYDPLTGKPVRRIAPGAQASRLDAIVANGAAVIYSVRDGGTWLATFSGVETRILDTHWVRSAAVLSVHGTELFALADLNFVVLIHPGTGAVVARIPFVGTVYSITAPQPECLCVVAADRITCLEVSPSLA